MIRRWFAPVATGLVLSALTLAIIDDIQRVARERIVIVPSPVVIPTVIFRNVGQASSTPIITPVRTVVVAPSRPGSPGPTTTVTRTKTATPTKEVLISCDSSLSCEANPQSLVLLLLPLLGLGLPLGYLSVPSKRRRSRRSSPSSSAFSSGHR